MNMGPILVSGTSGFIGGLLASRLGDGHIPFDPRQPLDFSSLPKEETSTIVHLGSPSNRVPGAEREIIDAAKKIFLEMHAYPWIDLIFSSTIRVFGQGGQISEKDEPIPLFGYGRGKRAAEEIFQQLDDGRNIDIFRISNVQGIDVSGKSRGVAGIFCSQSNNGKITINGDGTSVKDIIHVSEVVDSIIWALENKGRGLNTHHLGRNKISLIELSQEISARNDSKILHIEEDPYDISAWFEAEEKSKIAIRSEMKVTDILDEIMSIYN